MIDLILVNYGDFLKVKYPEFHSPQGLKILYFLTF